MFNFGAAYEGEHFQPFIWDGTNGGAMLLVHGFPGHPGDMRTLANHLRPQGWALHAPLLPGFGIELDQLPERSYEDWCEAVDAHLQRLIAIHRPVILVGYSMGGAISLALASRYPIDALVLLAPFWKIDHILWRTLPALKWLVRSFRPIKLLDVNLESPMMRSNIHEIMPKLDLDDPETVRALQDFKMPTRVIDQVRIAGQNGASHAPTIQVPTLVVQGTRDELVLPHLTQQLASRIPGPVTYVEVDSDHSLIEPDQPGWPAVAEAVDAFIQDNRLGAAYA
ncbi:MAG: alpha/beta fold hydrolase [Anaerolineae bacterium]|nr:alpha/beta fold hydrolase [Anaerolineae bacterium]MCA9896207.1 alpha/beta fold hydrolase [Anaerolineae bacterium]